MSYPRISIVTPSFNQGEFLETTIRSVLDQNYPNLEYIIMDGGSTDGSVDIIKRYEKHLAYWVSQKDRGQNHAITEGFKHATGDIYAYLNSDDMYFRWTFATIAQIFTQVPEIQWLTSRTTVVVDRDGDPIMTNHAIQHTRRRFYSGVTLMNHFEGDSGWIQQEATFWRKSLWEAAGSRMDESSYLVGDFELWARFYQHANLVTTDVPLAAYRLHGANKTHDLSKTRQASREILKMYPHEPKFALWQFKLLGSLVKYTGRGARRFGCRAMWLDYKHKTDQWVLKSRRII